MDPTTLLRDPLAIDIQGSGNAFAITFAGRQIGQANSYDNACVRALAAEKRLQQTSRRCLCCGETFTARGPWLRLCDPCKGAYA